MAERNVDTDPKKDREQNKQGSGVQAATDTRDESIVTREEGGAVEHKTPGPGSRKGDKHDLPLTGQALTPGPRKAVITVEEAQISVKVDGNKREGPDRPFADLDTESLLVLANAVRAEAGNR